MKTWIFEATDADGFSSRYAMATTEEEAQEIREELASNDTLQWWSESVED